METSESLDLKRLQERDPDALHHWVQSHYDGIYRFLRHLTRQTDVAEDLVQQTFLNALQALPKFRGEASQKTWLHRIAFREYIAWRRKRRLTMPLEFLAPKEDPGFESAESGEVLLAALHQLPSALREAFLLFEVQQFSIEEIAEITSSPAGTVKSRLHHARQRLQTQLGNTFLEVRYESR